MKNSNTYNHYNLLQPLQPITTFNQLNKERCLSGRKSTPGKCVYLKRVSRVRIPPSPLISISKYIKSLKIKWLQAFVFKWDCQIIHQFTTKWWVIGWVTLRIFITHQECRKLLIYNMLSEFASCPEINCELNFVSLSNIHFMKTNFNLPQTVRNSNQLVEELKFLFTLKLA